MPTQSDNISHIISRCNLKEGDYDSTLSSAENLVNRFLPPEKTENLGFRRRGWRDRFLVIRIR